MLNKSFQLKPCPDCKSKEIEVHYTTLKGWIISCKVCNFSYNPWSFYHFDETIEGWNNLERDK